MIPRSYIDYYGDQTRWFLGEVVNVADDPLKIGRVKVKVFGVYDEIKDEDLPWAQIVVPVTMGVTNNGVQGLGQYLGILVGTQVFGIFLDGPSSQLPLVVGTIPQEDDFNSKAIENYPHNKVYETEQGHYKEYDDTPDKTRIREQHASGTYTEMKHSGSRDTLIKKNEDLEVEGNRDTLIKKNEDLEVEGNRVTIIRKDDTLEIKGNLNIIVDGSAMISTKEATTITSRGDVYVNGNESVSVTGNVVTVNGKTIKLNS